MDSTSPSTAVGTIAAMITPALLIVGSASLVASALVRMGRIVDRARLLASAAHEGSWEKLGANRDQLRLWLIRHAARARYAERSIALLYLAVVAFVITSLAIALDRAIGQSLDWLPIMVAVAGTLLLLSGGALMVAESRLSGEQIVEEINFALPRLEESAP